MKIYTFVKGLVNGKPNLFVSVCDYCPEGWVSIDTREIHFNISTDEVLNLAKKSQEHLDSLMEGNDE